MLMLNPIGYQVNSMKFQSKTNQNAGFHIQPQQTKDSVSFGNTKTVVLKNGAEEAESLVNIVMNSLKNLLNEGISGVCASYDLAEACKNPHYKIDNGTAKKLEGLGLLNIQKDGSLKIHESVKNIINSAREGDGLDMSFNNPIAK